MIDLILPLFCSNCYVNAMAVSVNVAIVSVKTALAKQIQCDFAENQKFWVLENHHKMFSGDHRCCKQLVVWSCDCGGEATIGTSDT